MKNHRENCKCCCCKAKRGETFGENNSFYGKKHTKENIEKIKKNLDRTGIKMSNDQKNKISDSNKGKCNLKMIGNQNGFKNGHIPWNKGLKGITEGYWKGKKMKNVIVKHHIDGNKRNNNPSNFLLLPHYLHRSLHFRSYEYLVEINIEREYLKYFILKYDINTNIDDGKLVHHIDCKRSNNNKDNFIYLKDRGLHNKLHQEAYLYLVKIKKNKEYIEWFFSKGERKTELNLKGGD